jgi:demethylmenaquinone methyltransferase/2-methoxy-6-polyprenyl-1,4-benzoquinol methylase
MRNSRYQAFLNEFIQTAKPGRITCIIAKQGFNFYVIYNSTIMNDITHGQERAIYVQKMFGKIAAHYDLMNWLMTGGQDRRWRRKAIHLLDPKPGQHLLDLGSGTGDLAREAKRQCKGVNITAGDFTLNMMLVGQTRGTLPFLAVDALQLPFEDESFDGVVSGFLMRNVGNLDQAANEQFRVLKSGGKIVILETTHPGHNIFSPFIWLYMHRVIPLVGKMISGEGEAYQYLPETSEMFLDAEVLAERLLACGFTNIQFKRLMFGTVALHWATKP